MMATATTTTMTTLTLESAMNLSLQQQQQRVPLLEFCVEDEPPAAELDIETVQNVVSVVVPLFFGSIGIIGLLGNMLVLIVVAANPNMRSTTNLLIFNLAVADLLFIVFCIPFTAADYVLPYWPFGNAWCKVVQYLIIVTACCSIYTLVLMSLDRYLAVVHPVASMSVRTERHAFIAVCIIWIIILTCSSPALIIHGEYDSSQVLNGNMSCIPPVIVNVTEESVPTCGILPDANWPLFQVTFFLSSYVVPLFLICGLYIFMLIRLWKTVRNSAESQRGRRRVTRLVFVVVGVFAICWCPIQVTLVVKSLGFFELTSVTISLQIASHVLAYMNSCINPILYAFLSDNFLKAFRKIIYCKTRSDTRNRLGPVSKTTRFVSSGDLL